MKKKVLVCGCLGHMGQLVVEAVNASSDMVVLCGFDKSIDLTGMFNFPVFHEVAQINAKPDIIIDFSSPTATEIISKYAYENDIPIVVATTGLSEEQIHKLHEYSDKIPVFQSANMSLEVVVFTKLLKEYSTILGKNADIEILEKHHNRKADNPSGTAKMLFGAVNSAFNNEKKMVYGRTGKREKDEIGLASLRGGNIVGEHTVSFFSENETFSISHTAYSRMVFAEGSVRAARYLFNCASGFYNMNDLV